nr:uncharacterized protein LOC127330984 [Lolium perenne]
MKANPWLTVFATQLTFKTLISLSLILSLMTAILLAYLDILELPSETKLIASAQSDSKMNASVDHRRASSRPSSMACNSASKASAHPFKHLQAAKMTTPSESLSIMPAPARPSEEKAPSTFSLCIPLSGGLHCCLIGGSDFGMVRHKVIMNAALWFTSDLLSACKNQS